MHLRYRALIIGFLCLVAVPARAGTVPDGTERLYRLKCAKCHKLYDPAKYDDPSWEGWMIKMKAKARLSGGQYDAIRQYAETLRKREKAPAKSDMINASGG